MVKRDLRGVSAPIQVNTPAKAENSVDSPSRKPSGYLINTPCAVTYCGRSIVVTPRRRIVHGGRHETVNGRRRYVVNCRFECEWVEVWRGNGLARIVVRTGYFAAWELARVGSMDYESERVA